MELNLFQKFLVSNKFPYVAGAVVLLLIVLTVLPIFPKSNSSDPSDRRETGLFKLSQVFTSQVGLADKLQQNIKDQDKVSAEFAAWEARVAGRFPWRNKLPLATDKYFVFFDIIKKGFTARIYPDNDDLIEQIRPEVTRRLKKDKGIPLEDYTIDWDVYPKSNL